MRKKAKEIADEDFYSLKIGLIWQYFKSESFAFWMICLYLFVEYVRPQSIYPALDFLDWAKLAVIAAFFGCFSDKTVRWVSSSINSFLILFLVVIIISSINAYFPAVSYKHLKDYYLWVIIYFLIINIVNNRKRFFIFICIFLIASFKISLSLAIVWANRGFSFTTWGLKGPPGYFENSGELSVQMLVFWPIAWAFARCLKSYLTKGWYWLLMLMPITATMVIVGASSRGAQLALIVQLVVINYRAIFKPKSLIALGLALALILTFLPDAQKARFHDIGIDKSSEQRLFYWKAGIQMMKENPVFGVGYFNFAPYFAKHYPSELLYKKAQLPHNLFIQIGTDTGFVGLFLLVPLLLVALLKGNNFQAKGCEYNQKLIGKYANLSLIGFIVSSQFVTILYYPFLWIHLALLVSLRNSFREPVERKKTANTKIPQGPPS